MIAGRNWIGHLGVALIFGVGCGPGVDEEGVSWPDRLPFPDAALDRVDDRVVLRADLPHGPTPWSALAPARRGFSPVQTVVIPVDDPVDPASLPAWEELATEGSVRLIDLRDGQAWPVMAEIDAAPQEGPGALLVRPLVPLPDGADVVVALTSKVLTDSGEPLRFPWFEQAVAGTVFEGAEALGEAWRARVDALGELGVDDVTLAVGFEVENHRSPLEALVSEETPSTSWSLEVSAEGEDAPPRTWKQLRGTFRAPNWLGAEGQIGWDGAEPQPEGEADVSVFIHLPASVEGADGTAPVWVFGHGIFANPGIYFEDDADPSAMLELADRAGAVVVATLWRGLTTRDIAVPLAVGQDIATFPTLRDHLMQGVANTAALLELVREGGLMEDPLLEGVADHRIVRYHGISLGGIEGAVLQGVLGDRGVPSVLHVAGGMWSTMLERSSHWRLFEDSVIDSGILDPTDRQLAYAATQLWWDPIDPVTWAPQLRGRPLLWQIAAGDEQVPNVASWVLLRGVEARGVQPMGVSTPGLDGVGAPVSGPAFSVFDPQMGNSDQTNRPAETSAAHETPRRWEGALNQSLVFLDTEDPGQAVAPCGAEPCTPERTGP